jgi:hypothetical protein
MNRNRNEVDRRERGWLCEGEMRYRANGDEVDGEVRRLRLFLKRRVERAAGGGLFLWSVVGGRGRVAVVVATRV